MCMYTVGHVTHPHTATNTIKPSVLSLPFKLIFSIVAGKKELREISYDTILGRVGEVGECYSPYHQDEGRGPGILLIA